MRPRALLLATMVSSAAMLGLAAGPAHARLHQFDTCTEVVDWARASLDDGSYPERVSAFDGQLEARAAYPDPALDRGDDAEEQNLDVAKDTVPVAVAVSGAGDGAASTTNVQEAGIDEPDVVKNDGERLFVFAGDTLRIYDARRDVPTLLGELPLHLAGGTLLRSGGKLLALGRKPRAERSSSDEAPDPYDVGTTRRAEYPSMTRLIELDVADPSAPRVLRTLDAPGELLTARQSGSTVRAVIGSQPGIDLYDYAYAGKKTRAKIEDGLRLRDIVPRMQLRSSVSGKRVRRALAPCADISHPGDPAGVELLTVLTIDLDRGLTGIDRKGVLASPQVVYASAGTLYVGAARSTGFYEGDGEDVLPTTYTDIYAFDTSVAGQTSYVGSGRVRGLPLNQYAFSEWNGDLRVATTTDPWWFEGDAPPADNRVTVLRRGAAGGLSPVGLVKGLGKGETIHAVRFFGDRGYLVTFRQTDPLYTLDLADPAAPKVLGELKIPGYSAYLHPLGDGLLLGIGQDATERGRLKGAQASLFDVSDPVQPRRLAAHPLGEGYASSDYDPHAFLWWPSRRTAFVPYQGWGDWTDPKETAAPPSLVALRAQRSPEPSLVELGRIVHGLRWDRPLPQRAVVIGDRLFSISALGIASNRIDDLAPLGFVAFRPGWAVPAGPGSTP